MDKCIFDKGDIVTFKLLPAHVAYMKTRKMRETFESLEIKKMLVISTDENGFCTGLACSNKKSPLPIRVGSYRYFVQLDILLVFSQNMLEFCGNPWGKNEVLREIANRLENYPPKTTLESASNITLVDKSPNNIWGKTKSSHRLDGYALVPSNIVHVSPPIHKLKLIDYLIDNCVTCGARLINLVIYIPTHDGRAIKVPMKQCTNCGCFFEEHGGRLSSIIEKLSYPSNYIANREYLIPNFDEKRNKIRAIPSAAFAIHLISKSNNNHRLITVVNSESDRNPEADIYHYSDLFFRKVLLAFQRRRNITICNDDFATVGMFHVGNENNNLYRRSTIQSLTIRHGGGIYVNESSKEHFVDILLYSPFTDCMEVVPVSYDEEEDFYYMDITLLRWFVRKYGNPGITISAYQRWTDNYEMREESLLHAYGYTVAQKPGLSDTQRHAILAEVLDLEFLSKYSVLRLLQHNIQTHSQDKDQNARHLWELDMNFVINYKMNPQRFIISDIGI